MCGPVFTVICRLVRVQVCLSYVFSFDPKLFFGDLPRFERVDLVRGLIWSHKSVCTLKRNTNKSRMNQSYYIVRSKVDQRASQQFQKVWNCFDTVLFQFSVQFNACKCFVSKMKHCRWTHWVFFSVICWVSPWRFNRVRDFFIFAVTRGFYPSWTVLDDLVLNFPGPWKFWNFSSKCVGTFD